LMLRRMTMWTAFSRSCRVMPGGMES
jgi:hypothetical protein